MRNFNFNYAALFGGAALLLMPAAVFAQDAVKTDAPAAVKTAEDAPVSWTLKHKTGEKKQFRAQATALGETSQGQLNIALKTVQKREISKVEAGGGLRWISTPVSQMLTINGNELTDDSGKSVTMTVVSDSGIVTDLKSGAVGERGGDTLQQLGSVMTSTPVPSKPVKVGDTWTAEFNGTIFKGRKFTVTYTYLGRETVLGKSACKVKAAGDLLINTSAKDPAKMTGTLFIDPDNGDAIETKYHLENLDLPTGTGGGLKVSMDSETTLIIPGVNDKEDAKTDAGKKDGSKK